MEKIFIEVESLGKVNDGYHTIEELYDHRIWLFLALAKCRSYVKCMWREDPETPGWLTVYLHLRGISPEWRPGGFQISYHIPDTEESRAALLAQDKLMPHAQVWDGHNSTDVIARLKEWATSI